MLFSLPCRARLLCRALCSVRHCSVMSAPACTNGLKRTMTERSGEAETKRLCSSEADTKGLSVGVTEGEKTHGDGSGTSRPCSDVGAEGVDPLPFAGEAVTDAADAAGGGDVDRWRRMKKVLLLVSYSGKGYQGMQRNPGIRTIEEDLLQALHKVRAIPDQGLLEQQSVWFQRAARTDKGVSAVKQSVSLKMVADADFLESVNSHLPTQIRVFQLKRVTKRFDAKHQCCARTYLYMSPTFAFCPLERPVTEEFRISDEKLNEVNRLLGKYVGTHNFHNFTSRRKPSDPSNKRFIMSMNCGRTFVRRGLEFFIITVKGQSFMLHQIRKMVGLVMAVARGLVTEAVFERAWSLDRIDLPIAPPLGLVLDEVHYDQYNQRYGRAGSNTHEEVEWSAVEAQLERFREEHIYRDIVATELQEKSMLTWLETLPLHTFDIRAGDLVTPLQAAHQLANQQPDQDIQLQQDQDVQLQPEQDVQLQQEQDVQLQQQQEGTRGDSAAASPPGKSEARAVPLSGDQGASLATEDGSDAVGSTAAPSGAASGGPA